VDGAGGPSASTSKASSLSEQGSYSSESGSTGALGCGGRTGLALDSLEKASWWSPELEVWGEEVGQ